MAWIKGKGIPVIDLFAGPGGLSEGFASYREADEHAFQILLAIEKDKYAQSTLTMRFFFHQFRPGSVPEAYYDYLRKVNEPEPERRKRLYDMFPVQARTAHASVLLAELGRDDPRTIRDRIRAALGDRDDFVLLGGPPCQPYSVMGRSRNRGNPHYDVRRDRRQRLYVEYLQVLADHHPAVFVMENVKGLLSATLENQRIFERILEDLSSPCEAILREGRNMADARRRTRYRLFSLVRYANGDQADLRRFIIRMEKHGIPQARHRLIIIGIRSDIADDSIGPLTEMAMVPLGKVLSGLPAVRSGLSKEKDDYGIWAKKVLQILSRPFMKGQEEHFDAAVRGKIRDALQSIPGHNLSRGNEFIEYSAGIDYRPDWFLDHRLGGVCNHTTRLHIADDLHRYLFAACFAVVKGRSPVLRDFPPELLPKHKNAEKSARDGSFDDRFHVQLSNRPATTVTSHLAKDGHYFVHPDPLQCRSMTVREVARIQTFPDNYVFLGPRTAQYIQVGNAVPPLLAYQIAACVFKFLKSRGFVK